MNRLAIICAALATVEALLVQVDRELAFLSDATFDDLADAVDGAINETRFLQASYEDGDDETG